MFSQLKTMSAPAIGVVVGAGAAILLEKWAIASNIGDSSVPTLPVTVQKKLDGDELLVQSKNQLQALLEDQRHDQSVILELTKQIANLTTQFNSEKNSTATTTSNVEQLDLTIKKMQELQDRQVPMQKTISIMLSSVVKRVQHVYKENVIEFQKCHEEIESTRELIETKLEKVSEAFAAADQRSLALRAKTSEAFDIGCSKYMHLDIVTRCKHFLLLKSLFNFFSFCFYVFIYVF